MIRHPSISVGCSNVTEMMTTVSLQIVGIIEPIIQHADWFFPGGEEGGRESYWEICSDRGGLIPYLLPSFCIPFRYRVQRHWELWEPGPHQPQRQLQPDAVSRHGSDRPQAERPESTAAQRRHRQHDAGVLQKGRVCPYWDYIFQHIQWECWDYSLIPMITKDCESLKSENSPPITGFHCKVGRKGHSLGKRGKKKTETDDI